jgi:cytidylate kinase
MSIITIRGQLGSGAPEIGKMVASHLHYDYVDREIIANVAAKLRYPEQKIEKQEMPPATLLRRIRAAMEQSYPLDPDMTGPKMTAMYLPPSEIPLDDKSYLTGLKSVIKRLAAGKPIVIRGRGSQFILKDNPDAFHVLIIASLETRIKRIMSSMNLDEKSAKREIALFDGSRREFTKRYFKADLEDPMYYNLVINTDHFDYNAAVSIIINAVSSWQKS